MLSSLMLNAPKDNTLDMQVHMWEWSVFGALVVGLIGMDLMIHLRRPHEPTMRECTRWLVFYVSLAALFVMYSTVRHSPHFAYE